MSNSTPSQPALNVAETTPEEPSTFPNSPTDDDDMSEEEGIAEYEAFLRELDEDPALGASWQHALTSRGWR
jgi:hypothetical protein